MSNWWLIVYHWTYNNYRQAYFGSTSTNADFVFCFCLFVFFFQGIARLQRHQQIVDEVKLALKPFYRQGKITKDDYKLIMKKSVEKVCEMFVFEDHLLKWNRISYARFCVLQSWCSRVEYLECARFVLFQCKNIIPPEIRDVLIAKSVSVTAIHHAWLD